MLKIIQQIFQFIVKISRQLDPENLYIALDEGLTNI
ncbi:hypothetical protein NtB2_01608 [Lactococcus termiticola]|uniref:Uncharacterized protein n=1 Tax=Lactococcus termiticola TaxID=2169526 RepID=A0A2R5HHK6_9LACT|nr:hypothetical protein NtB2_01608 [Lactococcus termiticola]